MNILISNDDGYSSEGIKFLHNFLKKRANISVVAPETNKSGCSSALTLDRPISVKNIQKENLIILLKY